MSDPVSPLPTIREFGGHDWFLTKFSRRNLPHWELTGSTYFITIRVHREVGRPFLDAQLAKIVISALVEADKKSYDLYAFVVMPDHVHMLIKPLFGKKLSSIMKILKGATAYQINQKLMRSGKFWQTENFDHLVRDATGLKHKWEYIKENPVKAKLAKKPEDYPYSSFYTPMSQLVDSLP